MHQYSSGFSNPKQNTLFRNITHITIDAFSIAIWVSAKLLPSYAHDIPIPLANRVAVAVGSSLLDIVVS